MFNEILPFYKPEFEIFCCHSGNVKFHFMWQVYICYIKYTMEEEEKEEEEEEEEEQGLTTYKWTFLLVHERRKGRR